MREISQEVYNGFKDDEDSRREWLDMHTFWLSLYMQTDYAENSDPERSWGATESVPILTEACNQFQARTYKIFFPQDTFVSAIPMSKNVQQREDLEKRAERIGDHISWQLGYQDRTYKQDKDALFLGVPLHGSFFTKTYFNPRLKRFKVDNVRPTDLVVNYNVGAVRMENLRRKSHVLYSTVGETQQLVYDKYFLDPCIASTRDGESIYNLKVDESQGLTPGNGGLKRDKPVNLIEQHLWLDLDDSGQFKPYIVTYDLGARKIKRITIGYDADPQGNPLKDFEQNEYFTHYKYQENPDGFYGLGLGHAVGDLNSAVNIMLRQSMDAATLANDGNMSGFFSSRLGIVGDEQRMTLGKMTKIPDTVGDLKNSVMMMQFPGPNAALIQIMEAMDQRAQRLASVTEATTGTPDKVIQPTTYMAQIEQALEQFSSTQMRLANSLTDELQKIYKINQKYLPFAGYFVANGAPQVITQQDYADDMMVMPIFDPKFATQAQKVARAQAELQATMENPVNQGRPQVYDEAYRRYFEALDVDDIDALLPPQPAPENFDDQFLENAFFLMPKESRPLFDVFPEQNHMEHLAKIQQFILEKGNELQPDQVQDLLNHKMKHEGYLYGQEKGVMPQSVPQNPPTPPLSARQPQAMQGIPNGQAANAPAQ